MIFTADLPMPPSANNLFATYSGRRIITREYKAWRKSAGADLLEQWEAADKPTISKPYSVHIELNLNHQGDIANREKAITDLLVATIPGFPGDQWVNRMLIERNREIEGARVEVVTLPCSRGFSTCGHNQGSEIQRKHPKDVDESTQTLGDLAQEGA